MQVYRAQLDSRTQWSCPSLKELADWLAENDVDTSGPTPSASTASPYEVSVGGRLTHLEGYSPEAGPRPLTVSELQYLGAALLRLQVAAPSLLLRLDVQATITVAISGDTEKEIVNKAKAWALGRFSDGFDLPAEDIKQPRLYVFDDAKVEVADDWSYMLAKEGKS